MPETPCPWCSQPFDLVLEACPTCHRAPVILGRWRVTGLLGQGGMSRVFGGVELVGDKPVAIKIFQLDRVQGWKGWELFERGARALQSVRHPSLPVLHAFDRVGRGAPRPGAGAP